MTQMGVQNGTESCLGHLNRHSPCTHQESNHLGLPADWQDMQIFLSISLTSGWPKPLTLSPPQTPKPQTLVPRHDSAQIIRLWTKLAKL